jgi:hypothetical protein
MPATSSARHPGTATPDAALGGLKPASLPPACVWDEPAGRVVDEREELPSSESSSLLLLLLELPVAVVPAAADVLVRRRTVLVESSSSPLLPEPVLPPEQVSPSGQQPVAVQV